MYSRIKQFCLHSVIIILLIVIITSSWISSLITWKAIIFIEFLLALSLFNIFVSLTVLFPNLNFDNVLEQAKNKTNVICSIIVAIALVTIVGALIWFTE